MPPENAGPAVETLVSIVESATDERFAAWGGETTTFGRETPPTPSARVPDLLADAGSLVGVVPRLDGTLLNTLRDHDTDLTAVVVVTGRAREQLTGATRLAARSALEQRDITVYAHDGDSPVGVVLVDERVLVGLFDENGLAAALITDAPAVRTWGVTTCKRYRKASEPLFE